MPTRPRSRRSSRSASACSASTWSSSTGAGEVAPHGPLPLRAPAGRAPPVDHDHGEALVGEPLRGQVRVAGRAPPAGRAGRRRGRAARAAGRRGAVAAGRGSEQRPSAARARPSDPEAALGVRPGRLGQRRELDRRLTVAAGADDPVAGAGPGHRRRTVTSDVAADARRRARRAPPVSRSSAAVGGQPVEVGLGRVGPRRRPRGRRPGADHGPRPAASAGSAARRRRPAAGRRRGRRAATRRSPHQRGAPGVSSTQRGPRWRQRSVVAPLAGSATSTTSRRWSRDCTVRVSGRRSRPVDRGQVGERRAVPDDLPAAARPSRSTTWRLTSALAVPAAG